MDGAILAAIAASGDKRDLTKQKESLRVFRAVVTGVTSGLASIQRGDDDTDQDAGYPRVLARAPVVGDEVVAINLGGAPLILGVLGSAIEATASDTRTGAPLTSTSTSTSVYSPLLSESFVLPPGTWSLHCALFCGATNSAAASGIAMRFSSPSTTSGTSPVTATADNFVLATYANTFTGQSGTVSVGAEFRAQAGGTVTPTRWVLIVIAERTA